MTLARNAARLPLLAAAMLSAMWLGMHSREAAAQGVGDLAVAPTRVVLEGRERSAAINLINRGTRATTYRISVVNMKMTETGEFREITEAEPGAPFASDLFRYSPRSATLQPGAAQVIRIVLRKPPELADGEYRSHLFIRGDPPQGSGRSIEDDEEDEDLQIQLTPIFGITIPVIVRHGSVKADAAITDATLLPADREHPAPRLRFVIARDGNASLFGDIRISFVPQGKKEETVIGEVNGLSVYTSISRRIVETRLNLPNDIALRNGTIRVTYSRISEDGARQLAQAELPVR